MAENKNKLRVSAPVVEETKNEPVKKTKDKASKPKKKPESKVAKRRKESDGRVRICFGIFIFMISIFLIIAFASPYFGFAPKGKWLNSLGKFMSEEMFGIGTAYIIFLIGLLGLHLMWKKIYIKPWALWKYSLVFLIWIPLLLALIFNALPSNTISPYEIYFGLVGRKCFVFLHNYIGIAGVILLLIFTALTYIIFTFNIKFDFLKKKENDDTEEEDSDDEDEEDDDSNENSQPINAPRPSIIEEKPEETNITDTPDDDDDEEDGEDVEIKVIKKHQDDPEEKEETVEKKPEEIVEKKPEESIEEKPENAEEKPDIKIEVEEHIEEKQVKKNGEHFGLDTLYDPKLELSDYKLPPLDLLREYGDGNTSVNTEELEANKERIVNTLRNYSIEIEKIKATIGPTVTLYEIVPAAGVRISKIKNLQDDIALSLSALGIRIIAPIPGKGTVGIEVPNKKPQTVSMRSIISSEKFQKSGYALPFGIGKTIQNESYVADLAKMPHILMAGATGQGKSVGLNAIIASLLYSKHPAELKFVLVDPKKVELSLYRKIERHYLAKLPDSEDAIITDVRKVVRTLNSLCIEMDNRYELMKDAGVRNIKEYNEKFVNRKLNPYDGHRFMPYIVLVVDEFADLIMTAGREVEGPIARLAQLARAIGIHLIIATQRPSVKVITGTIKANFPGRIAFRVISRVDSATILDSNGAEQLIGRGDMLMSTGQDLVRLQCPFIDTPEVEAICDFIGEQRGYSDAYILPDCPDEQEDGASKESMDPNERDPLFEEAAHIVVQTQQGSTSMLQRKLKLGYNRAGRIIDQLEKAGIVGPFAGSKQREVKVATEFALEQFLKDLNLEDNIKNNELI
ncbi:MAG: DNA translocase FtsK [Bacteroidales bacterium]|nr:DNA translocase FtsK [Bacteroidales bacterium]